MKLKVLKCVCFKESCEPGGEGIFDGMPYLRTSSNMDCWEAYCPNCRRGGIVQYKSPYLALKAWNAMQWGLRSDSWFVPVVPVVEKEKQDN